MGIRVAVTRGVSSNIGECELTHLDREPIDVDLARTQHARYEQVLADPVSYTHLRAHDT